MPRAQRLSRSSFTSYWFHSRAKVSFGASSTSVSVAALATLDSRYRREHDYDRKIMLSKNGC